MSLNDSAQPKLTARQVKAIEALLTEPNATAAATVAGVSKPTIFRWLANADFVAAYRDARMRLLESALAKLQATADDAVETLKTVMNSASAPAPARVSAARCVLEMALKSRDTLEVEERLKALEASIYARQKAG
jgi:phage terminase small subunit